MPIPKNVNSKYFFVLYAPSQVNSFLKSGILEQLSKRIDLTVIIESETFLELLRSTTLKVLKLDPPIQLSRSISSFLQLATLWRFRDRSMNHLVRANASFGTKKERELWRCVVVSEMRMSLLRRLIVRMFSHKLLYRLLKVLEEGVSRILFERKAFRQFMNNDIILIPYSGHVGGHFNPWVRGANRRGIPTVALQENWDNLSTKAYITEEPKFFCVWGSQSAGHIRSIHRLLQVEPWIVGSPRFDSYIKQNFSKPIVSNWTGDKLELTESAFVLVAGTGDGIDDLVLITETYRALHKVEEKKVTLVYRPHPMTRTQPDFVKLEREFPEILIDSGPMAQVFGHHIALVKHAQIVINHFSTLTIEAILAGTPVITPLFLGRKEAKYRYNQILSEWHHMMGLALVPGVYAPENISQMKNYVRELVLNESKLGKADITWICESIDYVDTLMQKLGRM